MSSFGFGLGWTGGLHQATGLLHADNVPCHSRCTAGNVFVYKRYARVRTNSFASFRATGGASLHEHLVPNFAMDLNSC